MYLKITLTTDDVVFGGKYDNIEQVTLAINEGQDKYGNMLQVPNGFVPFNTIASIELTDYEEDVEKFRITARQAKQKTEETLRLTTELELIDDAIQTEIDKGEREAGWTFTSDDVKDHARNQIECSLRRRGFVIHKPTQDDPFSDMIITW